MTKFRQHNRNTSVTKLRQHLLTHKTVTHQRQNQGSIYWHIQLKHISDKIEAASIDTYNRNTSVTKLRQHLLTHTTVTHQWPNLGSIYWHIQQKHISDKIEAASIDTYNRNTSVTKLRQHLLTHTLQQKHISDKIEAVYVSIMTQTKHTSTISIRTPTENVSNNIKYNSNCSHNCFKLFDSISINRKKWIQTGTFLFEYVKF